MPRAEGRPRDESYGQIPEVDAAVDYGSRLRSKEAARHLFELLLVGLTSEPLRFVSRKRAS